MPSQQNLREANRRLREDNNRLRDELAAMTVQYNGIAELYEELKASYDNVQEKNRKAKEAAKKRREWNDTLSYHLMVHRKFICDQIGYPPDLRGDAMTEFDHGVLAYYLRPYAHFAPQILIPDEMYTVDRMCLLCGIMIPHSRAVGKCNGCVRNAWYCSTLCQRTHWPIHRADHIRDDPEGMRPDVTGFA